MIKLEFYFGVGEDASGNSLHACTVDTAKLTLLRYASDLAGGCSLVAHTGAWLDNGRLITEPGYCLVVFSVLTTLTPYILTEIKALFRQKSVLVVQSEVSATFS